MPKMGQKLLVGPDNFKTDLNNIINYIVTKGRIYYDWAPLNLHNCEWVKGAWS